MIRRALKRVVLWLFQEEINAACAKIVNDIKRENLAPRNFSTYAHLAKQRIKPAMERYPEKQS